MDTITKIIRKNLCISCGICAANCSTNCITIKREGSQFFPQIDEVKCVKCGLCRKVCPGDKIFEYDGTCEIEDYLLGDYKAIYCAKTKDKTILRRAASGGVVTQSVLELLKHGEYQSAFLLSGYCYNDLLETKRFVKGDVFDRTPKSRYLTVSHEQSMRYLIEHPDEKVILVATGCVVSGILNTIKYRHLKRDNYFIIGLFCDKTMHYGVIDYFSAHTASQGKKLKDLYFRTKDFNGWPGSVRLVYTDGSYQDLPNTERTRVKNYFRPERCCYCLDKLNRNCDIAVGDNYIKANADKNGVSSVIIRTEQGQRLWNIYCRDMFSWHCDSAIDLIQSQVLGSKKLSYEFACLKGIYPTHHSELSSKAKSAYSRALRKIEIGKSDNVYAAVNEDIKLNSFKNR